MTGPLCRTCAKPIRKRTINKWVNEKPYVDHYITTIGERGQRYEVPRSLNTLYDTVLHSKAECQERSNEQVVSVKYRADGTVSHFGTWDGKSYEDDLFCSNTCAISFARMCAYNYPNIETVAYAAKRKQKVQS